MTKQLVDLLTPILPILVSAALTWLAARAARYLSSAAQVKAVEEVHWAADRIVLALAQTVGDKARELSEDGSLSPEDRQALKSLALDKLVEQVSAEAKRALAGRLDSIAHDAVESAVRVTRG